VRCSLSRINKPVPAGWLTVVATSPRMASERGVSGANIETLSPTRTGVLSAQLTSPHEQIKLTVAPNSVLAVSPSS
ncbi:MAG TPA: hypothetical protein VK680_05375, partial [Solirubrobacteraceae bacterium]|nr:hypothetical protein [Solirubrobacteraceae bacterium]